MKNEGYRCDDNDVAVITGTNQLGLHLKAFIEKGERKRERERERERGREIDCCNAEGATIPSSAVNLS